MTTLHITLSPQRSDDELKMEKRGSILILNGREIDVERYDPAASPCKWIVDTPERMADGWAVTVLLPHGPAAPPETRFPEPVIAVADGPIHLPPYGYRVQNRIQHTIKSAFQPPSPRVIAKPRSNPNLKNLYIDPSALDAIPESHAAIGESIAYWAATDMHLRTFLLTRFGPDTNSVSGLIEFHARADDALACLLRVAGSMTGDEKISSDCAGFLDRRDQVKAFRDVFAHGTWLLSGDYPDGILLMKSKAALSMMKESMDANLFEFPGFKAQFEIWTSEDFRRARTCAVALRNEAIQLIGRFPPIPAVGG